MLPCWRRTEEGAMGTTWFWLVAIMITIYVLLDGSGYFFEPLWTNFRLGDETGILDWYTILVGVLALLALMMHGGLWVQMKISGEVSRRAGRVAGQAWWGVVALTTIVTALTFR